MNDEIAEYISSILMQIAVNMQSIDKSLKQIADSVAKEEK